MNRWRNLLVRLDAIALLVVVLVGIVALAYAWQFEDAQGRLRQSTLASAEKHTVDLADALGEQVELLLRGSDLALQQLREDWVSDRASFDKSVRTVKATFPDRALVHVAVIGADGLVVYSSLGVGTPTFAGDREHFRVHAEGKADQMHVSKVIYGRVSNTWTILVTRPIRRDGNFAGVMVVGLSPEYMSQRLATLQMSPNDVVVLLHGDGSYLARNRDWQKAMGKAVEADRPFLRKDAPRKGVFHAPGTLDKLPRIFGWHRLEVGGLLIVVGLDQQSLFQAIDAQYAHGQSRGITLLLVLLGLGGGIALLLVNLGQQQRALAKNQEQLNEAQRLATLGSWDWDVAAQAQTWSKELYNLFGRDPVRAPPDFKELPQYFTAESWDLLVTAIEAARTAGTPFECEAEIVRADGSQCWITARGKATRDDSGKIVRLSGTVQDISERKALDEQVRNLAYYDSLTGLPNRRLLLDRLQRALSQAKRFQRSLGIMFLDLDNFKKINDTLGHDIGDELLKEVAIRLTTCVRAGDTVSRLGGDEFVILLAEIAHPIDAERVAEKVLSVVSQPIQIEQHTLNISTSIGIAVYPVDGNDDARELMRKADKAMYAAKDAGRNGYRFFTD